MEALLSGAPEARLSKTERSIAQLGPQADRSTRKQAKLLIFKDI